MSVIAEYREPISLIFLGMEESFFESETPTYGAKRRLIPDAVEQFYLLIEKVKKMVDVRIVITSSWGKRAKDLEELKAQLDGFSFKDRVIDAVVFSDSGGSFFTESSKIRSWLLKNHEKWRIESLLVVGSFQALHEIRFRFSHVPSLFGSLGVEGIACTGSGSAFSYLDVEPAYKMLMTKDFSIDSLESWEPIESCAPI